MTGLISFDPQVLDRSGPPVSAWMQSKVLHETVDVQTDVDPFHLLGTEYLSIGSNRLLRPNVGPGFEFGQIDCGSHTNLRSGYAFAATSNKNQIPSQATDLVHVTYAFPENKHQDFRSLFQRAFSTYISEQRASKYAATVSLVKHWRSMHGRTATRAAEELNKLWIEAVSLQGASQESFQTQLLDYLDRFDDDAIAALRETLFGLERNTDLAISGLRLLGRSENTHTHAARRTLLGEALALRDAAIRYAAVIGLGELGGADALKMLREHFPIEHNRTVRSAIKAHLT